MNAAGQIAAITPSAGLRDGRGEATFERRFSLGAERVLAVLNHAARPGQTAAPGLAALRALVQSHSQSSGPITLTLGSGGQATLATATQSLPLPAVLREPLLALARGAAPAGQPAAALPAPAATAPLPTLPPAGPEASALGQWLALATGLARAAPAGERGAARARLREGRALLEAEPGRALDTLGAAGRLRFSLEMSGLFYEAHLRQWVLGQRAEATLREEAARLLAAATPEPAAAARKLPGGAERLAAQLALIEHETLSLALPAWSGQRLELEVGRVAGREEHAAGAGAAATKPVHDARLVLDLPRLGRVEARLRLAGGALALEISAPASVALESALPQLREQLAARGIAAAHLSVKAAP